MKSIEVVAAIIRDGDRVFATQRGYGPWKDWWEFPGGKMEERETEQEALVREIKEELSAPQSPKLTNILAAYYGQRNTGAWSNKAKSGNLKQYAETVNFLLEKKLYTVEDLEAYVSGLSRTMDGLKTEIIQAKAKSKSIRDLLTFSQITMPSP